MEKKRTLEDLQKQERAAAESAEAPWEDTARAVPV
jgi:hypothetical protein